MTYDPPKPPCKRQPCDCFDCDLWRVRYGDRVEGRKEMLQHLIIQWRGSSSLKMAAVVDYLRDINPETLEHPGWKASEDE